MEKKGLNMLVCRNFIVWRLDKGQSGYWLKVFLCSSIGLLEIQKLQTGKIFWSSVSCLVILLYGFSWNINNGSFVIRNFLNTRRSCFSQTRCRTFRTNLLSFPDRFSWLFSSILAIPVFSELLVLLDKGKYFQMDVDPVLVVIYILNLKQNVLTHPLHIPASYFAAYFVMKHVNEAKTIKSPYVLELLSQSYYRTSLLYQDTKILNTFIKDGFAILVLIHR